MCEDRGQTLGNCVTFPPVPTSPSTAPFYTPSSNTAANAALGPLHLPFLPPVRHPPTLCSLTSSRFSLRCHCSKRPFFITL